MRYQYVTKTPYDEILKSVEDEKTVELWIVFAYFSSNKVLEILKSIERRKHPPIVHMIFSASSSNPIQDLIEPVIAYLDKSENLFFYLVEEPLMHSKVFAAKYQSDDLMIYLGSGNLTNKAQNHNIESGVVFEFKPENSNTTDDYLNNLKKTCSNGRIVDSIDDLKRRAIFSHIRNELLFLALDESKVSKSIHYSPSHLKRLIHKNDDDNSIKRNVEIKTQKTLRVSILKPEDEELLLNAEKKLKEEIKKTYAIKLDGYRWISSCWSIRRAIDEKSLVKNAYSDFLECLKNIKNKYKSIYYRQEVKMIIDSELRNNIDYQVIHDEDSDKFLSRFDLDILHEKSLYKNLEKLYKRTSETSDIKFLLNPYRISDDEIMEENDNIGISSIDQFNLIVMCNLAIKLRIGGKYTPKAPAAWWFDIALDKDFFIGFDSVSKYRDYTKKLLENIIIDLQDSNSEDLFKCLDDFCKITGFNLGMKYPSTNQLISDTNKIQVIQPYCFIDSERKYFNLSNMGYIGELIISLDKDKMPDGYFMKSDKFSKTLKGLFVLGDNLKFWYDENTHKTYLYVNSLDPKNG